MEGNLSLEEQFWTDLQRALNVLGVSDKEPANQIFSLWYKDYGEKNVSTIKQCLPFFVGTYDGNMYLKQAVYTLGVGLDGFENHNDKKYLSEMTALAIDDLYLQMATEQ